MKRDRVKIRCGFTLVELLTTLAVIGILLGLLIPALNQVSKTATKIKQKAQFYAIGTALEAFRNDYGDYPPSEWDALAPVVDGDISYGNYCASQRLAEAIVGRDGLGFYPTSKLIENGTDGTMTTPGNPLYYPDIAGFTDPQKQANLAARKGPYLELESANAVKLNQLSLTILGPLNLNTYVLVDMYKIVKNSATGKEVGMPILYYKANKLKINNSSDPPDWDSINTYSLNDSFCNGLGVLSSGNHYNGDVPGNASIFYNAIANPNFTSPPRPYRAESFILHSAGPDGLYGTTDDVFNFETEK